MTIFLYAIPECLGYCEDTVGVWFFGIAVLFPSDYGLCKILVAG